jgi:integrase
MSRTNNTPNTSVCMLLSDYFARVFAPRRLLGKSAQTSILHRLTIARLGEYLERPARLDDLCDEVLCGFLAHRLAQGRAGHTVDKERSKLLAIANYAARKRHIPEFVDVPTLAPASIAPRSWGRAELDKLLAACRTTTGTVGVSPAALWWSALHLLFLYTGERTSAALGIKWEWLAADGWLSIPAAYRKGGKQSAAYFLPPVVLEALEALRPYTGGGADVFALPWLRGHKSGAFYLRYGKLLQRAGLPSGRRFKPQALRRTFATMLEAAGGDATAALGHSSRRVTVASYLDPTKAVGEPSSVVFARGLHEAT